MTLRRVTAVPPSYSSWPVRAMLLTRQLGDHICVTRMRTQRRTKMALTPKLNENVMDAIAEALKSLKPRPAVDRVLTARLTGKRAHYCQILLAYSPSEFGV